MVCRRDVEEEVAVFVLEGALEAGERADVCDSAKMSNIDRKRTLFTLSLAFISRLRTFPCYNEIVRAVMLGHPTLRPRLSGVGVDTFPSNLVVFLIFGSNFNYFPEDLVVTFSRDEMGF
jgi:hypothetical protein